MLETGALRLRKFTTCLLLGAYSLRLVGRKLLGRVKFYERCRRVFSNGGHCIEERACVAKVAKLCRRLELRITRNDSTFQCVLLLIQLS